MHAPTQTITGNDDSTSLSVERRNRVLRSVRGLWVAASVCAFFLGYALYRRSDAKAFPLQEFSHTGDWIEPAGEPGYAGYYRHVISLPENVANAWLCVSACDSFEITVNRNPVARNFLWRPTRPFQNGLSTKGQRVGPIEPSMAMNFPREYQWTDHQNYILPVFVDIRPELVVGKNVFCIKTESRALGTKIAVTGEVTLASGKSVSLNTSRSWRAETVPRGSLLVNWTELDFDDSDWRTAQSVDGPPERMWSTPDPLLFATTFEPWQLRHPAATAQQSVSFRKCWNLDSQPQRAWLRFATNRSFDLFVNDTHVQVAHTFPPDVSASDWILDRQNAIDLPGSPTLLDPDDIDSIYTHGNYTSPRHGDPTNDVRIADRPFVRSFHSIESPTVTHALPGDYDPKPTLGQTRRTPLHPDEFPVAVEPPFLHHDRGIGGFLAYDVSRLLKSGKNTIEFRLAPSDSVTGLNWSPQMAVDGRSIDADGRASLLDSSRDWQCACDVYTTSTPEWVPAVATGRVSGQSMAATRLEYLGAAESGEAAVVAGHWMVGTLAVFWLLCGIVVICVVWRTQPQISESIIRLSSYLFTGLSAASVVMFTAMAVEVCFAERHELLWFRLAFTWQVIVALAAGIGISAAVLGREFMRGRSQEKPVTCSLLCLPETKIWPYLIAWVLLFSFVLRAHKLDFQPLDDDEYASTQAILAIVETGIPSYVPEGVWYTRSPLFHYLIGGFAFVFGANLWSMRLPIAFLGVATCWLTYLCGASLLKSRWVGMAAMLLMAIHPFEVFTSHVIRFYQLQQFLGLLTVYLFCQGFVTGQSQRYRYATIISFTATVLTQEISVLIGFSLLLGYLVFAKPLGRRMDTKLVIAACCAIVVMVLDYAVFETRCMTRLEGTSPNLEATVTPHLWHPYNFLSLFVSYSRLHVFPSLFLLIGLPLACRSKQRNTLALYLMLFTSVVLTNVMVTHVSLRYQYWLFPIWALLSLEGVRLIFDRVCSYGIDLRRYRSIHGWALGITSFTVFVGMVLSFSPWRLVGSHDRKLVGDSTGAMQFIRSNLRDGDVVMVTEPHTHAALLEAGRCDYDLSVPLLYDFAVMQDGKLVDRNAGAAVVGNLTELADKCRNHQRIWLAVNREKIRNRGKHIRWEYPAARVDSFVRQNFELVHDRYLWSVYLWDADCGRLVSFREDRI